MNNIFVNGSVIYDDEYFTEIKLDTVVRYVLIT